MQVFQIKSPFRWLVMIHSLIASASEAAWDHVLHIPSQSFLQLLSSSACVGNISSSEYTVLEDLYTSTDGTHWLWHTILNQSTQQQWVFPSSLAAPCEDQWQGITCGVASVNKKYGDTCFISAIDLPLTNLRGRLPTSLGLLSNLDSLRLPFNLLSGSIPSELGNLSTATVLGLNNNRFTGSIPSGLAVMGSLTQLYLNGNNLTSTIPSQLGSLGLLKQMDVYENRLTGPMPSALGDMTSLRVLRLQYNHLTGSIPSELGHVRSLTLLSLFGNLLTGFIPSDLGDLGSLSFLWLENNYLSGSISSALGGLSSLKELAANTNSLSGSIPSELANLESLTQLYLNYNYLTGPIPSELGRMGNLTGLFLYANSLSGSIPSELASLESLRVLYLNFNRLTGPIPSQLGNLGSLIALFLENNCLSGSIPMELGSLSLISGLYLETNRLTGSIPSQLGGMVSLTYMTMASNCLTGSIPSELGKLSLLRGLYINNNYLAGSLPSQLGGLASLAQLYLNNNGLIGSIPSQLGSMRSLTEVYMYSNSLTMSIPSELGDISSLVQLYLNDNRLSGTIPPELSSLRLLQEVNLGANSFSGGIPIEFSSMLQCYLFNLSSNALTGTVPSSLGLLGSYHTFLVSSNLNGTLVNENKTVILDLSRNGFTGTIPPALFSKNMQTVSLYSNCFHGTLPAEICSATQLQTLVLDQLTSGQRCVVSLPGFRAKFPRQFLEGSIPSCVWLLPQLQTLHVSGNGLQGTLGKILPTSQLTVVDAANNFLTGAIPTSIQKHTGLQQLVLTSNKLSGTLLDSFCVSNMTNLALAVNRLSGEIPPSFYSSSLQLNILSGNLFSCADNNDLPPNDPYSDSYVCGSDALNYSLFGWGACVAFTVLLILLYWCLPFYISSNGITFSVLAGDSCGLFHVWKMTLGWWCRYSDAVAITTRLSAFMAALESSRTILCVGAITIVIVCTSVFASLKLSTLKAGTISKQYTWVISGAFMHGSAAAMIVALFVAITSIGSAIVIRQIDYHGDNNSVIAGSNNQRRRLKNVAQRILFQSVSMCVLFAINVAYVYFVSGGSSSGSLTAVQIALSLFKLAWKELYINWAIDWMRRNHDDLQSSGLLYYNLSMSIFNFLVAPCLATLGTDSRCLYDAVVGEVADPSSFKITFFLTLCITVPFPSGLAFTRCFPFPYKQLLTVDITPPWLYSYQCSSALLTNYVSVLLLTYTASGVVMPVVQYGALFLPTPYWNRLIGLSNQLLGGPLAVEAENQHDKPTAEEGDRERSSCSNDVISTQLAAQESTLAKDSNEMHSELSGGSIKGEEQKDEVKLFQPERLKVNLLLDLAVLLTYGLAAPLLALAVVFKQITTSILMRLVIGKFLSLSGSEQGSMTQSLARLETLVKRCGPVNLATLILLSVIVFGFWSAMVFDMVADVYGNGLGGIASLTVVLGWAAVACGCGAIVVWRTRVNNTEIQQKTEGRVTNSDVMIRRVETVTIELGEVYNDLYAVETSSGSNPQSAAAEF